MAKFRFFRSIINIQTIKIRCVFKLLQAASYLCTGLQRRGTQRLYMKPNKDKGGPRREHAKQKPKPKREHAKIKAELHPRNRHRERYDFDLLTQTYPELSPFVKPNPYGDISIDFADPAAVKALNTALLKQYYGIKFWDLPEGYLCPPIPGRADYIHHMATLLGNNNFGKIPTGPRIHCLDVGVGANCIYPIIGHHEYGWGFVGSDIDPVAIKSANAIVEFNPVLKGNVICRLQPKPIDIFFGIIKKDELFDLSICNPPFFASLEEAQAETTRKWSNLTHEEAPAPKQNFGGQNGELWCEGGEAKFIQRLVRQSRQFSNSVFWFSTLVSKKYNLPGVYAELKKAQAVEVVTIPMGQGSKISRIVAWTFLTKEEQKVWKNTRWQTPKEDKAPETPPMEVKAPELTPKEIKAPEAPSEELKAPKVPPMEVKAAEAPAKFVKKPTPVEEPKAPAKEVEAPKATTKAVKEPTPVEKPEAPAKEVKAPKATTKAVKEPTPVEEPKAPAKEVKAPKATTKAVKEPKPVKEPKAPAKEVEAPKATTKAVKEPKVATKKVKPPKEDKPSG